MHKLFLIAGCIFACVAVMLGAFAAHGLKGTITALQLQTFQTGVTYQFFHALALLFVGLALKQYAGIGFVLAGGFFIAGVVLFSGSLYALSLNGPKFFGPITPIGGLCFILGWITAIVTVIKSV